MSFWIRFSLIFSALSPLRLFARHAEKALSASIDKAWHNAVE
jgi:hypothetical protein